MMAVESNVNMMIIAAAAMTKEWGGITFHTLDISAFEFLCNYKLSFFLNVVFHICSFIGKAKKESLEFRYVR